MAQRNRDGWRRRAGRRRSRGQSAILEVGLASAVATALLVGLSATVRVNASAEVAIAAADQQQAIAKAAAGYLQANYHAFMNAAPWGTGSACGGTVVGSNIVYPITGTLPSLSVATPCTTLYTSGLMPDVAALTNSFQQTYSLVVRQVTPPGGQPQLSSFLATVGGAPIPDALAGVVVRRIGYAAGNLASAANQSFLGSQVSGTNGNFQVDPATLGNVVTPGHPVVDLNYLVNTDINQNLQRYASSVDTAPQRLAGTLYLAGVDSSNGGAVNMALNGAPIASGTAAAAAALAGGGTQPTNSIMGARALDAQVLTGGSSVAVPWKDNAAQTAAESAGGQAVNDWSKAAYKGHTILADANLDVVAGFRLAAADGLHVTAGTLTAPNDASGTAQNPSPNGAVAPVTNGWGGEPLNAGQAAVPGIQWDGVGNAGLMAFVASAPNEYFLATYSRSGTPVGLEADGGMRAPAYYDNQLGTYFVKPAGNSNLEGNLTAGGNIAAGKDVTAGCNVTAGAGPYAKPPVACGNVTGEDFHSSGVVYNDLGVISQGNVTAADYLIATGAATPGASCAGDPGLGGIGVDTGTKTPLWCNGKTWGSLVDGDTFYTLRTSQSTGNPYANPNSSIKNWETNALNCPANNTAHLIYDYTDNAADHHTDYLFVCVPN